MVRRILAVAVGIGAAACAGEAPQARPAPATPSPAAVPAQTEPAGPVAVKVDVEVGDATTEPLAREWARELEAVLTANPAQFRLVTSDEEADLKVRIERVVTPKDLPGHQVMTLLLAVDDKPARFTLDYTGGPVAMAGKLARFLAGHVEKVRSGAASDAAAPSANPSR